eukprot:1250534-Amphidinium_carterae.1
MSRCVRTLMLLHWKQLDLYMQMGTRQVTLSGLASIYFEKTIKSQVEPQQRNLLHRSNTVTAHVDSVNPCRTVQRGV